MAAQRTAAEGLRAVTRHAAGRPRAGAEVHTGDGARQTRQSLLQPGARLHESRRRHSQTAR